MGRNINTSSNEYKNLIKENKDLKKIISDGDNEFKKTFMRCLKDKEFRNCIAREVNDYNDEVDEDY